PFRPESPDRGEEIRSTFIGGWSRQRFELGTNRFAGCGALLPGDVMAPRVPREEAVARAPEPLPDGLGPALLHRTDGAPLVLEPFDLDCRSVPIGRIGEG